LDGLGGKVIEDLLDFLEFSFEELLLLLGFGLKEGDSFGSGGPVVVMVSMFGDPDRSGEEARFDGEEARGFLDDFDFFDLPLVEGGSFPPGCGWEIHGRFWRMVRFIR
jgi:hypothetical protein